MINHIAMNLISNAVKFSAEDGQVTIKTVNTGDVLLFSVSDNGIGISEEDQKHLMERFFRGSNATNIQGTGLGLHIVARYTELMNGAIECRSRVGLGTTFTLTFRLQ